VSATERAPLIAAHTGPIATKADGRPALPTPGEVAEVARGAYEIGLAIATGQRSTRRWRAGPSARSRSPAPTSCTPRPPGGPGSSYRAAREASGGPDAHGDHEFEGAQ